MTQPSPGEITRILEAVSSGEEAAAEDLLALVYDHLHNMARVRMADERLGHTLQPTALVHETYLRLFADQPPAWENRFHFFSAAAEAMRRILIDRARRRDRQKRGGDQQKVDLDSAIGSYEPPAEELLALDEALTRLESIDPQMAQVVKLRYFAGLTIDETAQALQASPRTVSRLWTHARTWLHSELRRGSEP